MGGSGRQSAARYARAQSEEESEFSPRHREGEGILNALICPAFKLFHTRTIARVLVPGGSVLYCLGGWVEDAGITLRVRAAHFGSDSRTAVFFPFFLYGGILSLRLIGATPPSLVSLSQLQANWLPAFNRYLLSSVSVSLLFLCLPSTHEE